LQSDESESLERQIIMTKKARKLCACGCGLPVDPGEDFHPFHDVPARRARNKLNATKRYAVRNGITFALTVRDLAPRMIGLPREASIVIRRRDVREGFEPANILLSTRQLPRHRRHRNLGSFMARLANSRLLKGRVTAKTLSLTFRRQRGLCALSGRALDLSGTIFERDAPAVLVRQVGNIELITRSVFTSIANFGYDYFLALAAGVSKTQAGGTESRGPSP
jgi:hypothetical protein